MKRGIGISIIILIVSLLYWGQDKPEKLLKDQPTAQKVKEKQEGKKQPSRRASGSLSIENKDQLVQPLVGKEVSKNGKEPTYETAPDLRANELSKRNLLEYEMKKDMAVAFGDIMLGEIVGGAKAKKGVAKAHPIELWPSSEIPFGIEKGFPNPDRVMQAIDYFRENTPMEFVPLDGHQDGIIFVKGEEHCYSYVGKIGGVQPITLSDKCGPWAILHEIMHALGFIHEQNRNDRDRFVEIHWDNIEIDAKKYFSKAPESWMDPMKGSRFDFNSVMLYHPSVFAKSNEVQTMTSIEGWPIDPVTDGLSQSDLDRVHYLYGR